MALASHRGLHSPGLPYRSFPGLRPIASSLHLCHGGAGIHRWVRSVRTSSLSPLCLSWFSSFPSMCKCQRPNQPASDASSHVPAFSTLLPSSLTFALPAASGQSPAKRSSLIMVPQTHGLLLLYFLLQLQGPLGAVGTYIHLSVQGGFLGGLSG